MSMRRSSQKSRGDGVIIVGRGVELVETAKPIDERISYPDDPDFSPPGTVWCQPANLPQEYLERRAALNHSALFLG